MTEDVMDGDALAGSNMAREMAELGLDPASIAGTINEIEEKRGWKCSARQSSLPEPADCDWPMCDCDPYATKVTNALVESGYDILPRHISDHRKPWTEPTVTELLCNHSTGSLADFQRRVQPWLMVCFGAMIAGDRKQRNHRFFEESLELIQSLGCTASEAHQLVDYVYGRDIGEPAQEVGGVMVTLAALCLANGLDMHENGETELARIWTMVDAIRAKQAAKPKHSPLPVAVTECATTNRMPAAMTIAGVDLPNPENDDSQIFHELGAATGWPNDGDDGEYRTEIARSAIAEIQRQAAEIAELQGMLEEAIGPVRLVSEIATMTDTECDFMDAGDLRLRARGQLDGDFTMPRLYDDEDRKRAVAAVLADRPKTNPLLAMEVVDIVAAALGLRRAS